VPLNHALVAPILYQVDPDLNKDLSLKVINSFPVKTLTYFLLEDLLLNLVNKLTHHCLRPLF